MMDTHEQPLVVVIEEAARNQMRVSSFDGGLDVMLGHTLRDGENLVIHVQDLGGGNYILSDLGQVAASLSVRGIDLSKRIMNYAWKQIADTLKRDAPITLVQPDAMDEFALTVPSHLDDLPSAFASLTEAMLRADGLAFLPAMRARRPRFVAQVAELTESRGLEVVDGPTFKTKSGLTRTADLVVTGDAVGTFYVQAVSHDGGNQSSAASRTYAIFGDSVLPREQLITVLDTNVTNVHEYESFLGQVSTVVPIKELDAFWDQKRQADLSEAT